MQKIYVLLRNDRQTGPYSLQEIIQFDLKPYDLIWIQGQSAGWYYPQEIAALHPYLSFLPKKPQPLQEVKPVFATRPNRQVETPTPPPVFSGYTPEEPPVQTQATSSTAALEEAVYAQFQKKPEKMEPTDRSAVSPTKAPKKPVNSAIVGLATVLIVGGVFAASWILNRKDSIAAEIPMEIATGQPAQAEIGNAGDNPNSTLSSNPSSPISAAKKTRTTRTSSQQQGTATTATVSVSRQPAPANEPVQETGSEPQFTPQEAPPVAAGSEKDAEATESEDAAPAEKKKKLRDKLFDIFRKKTGEAKEEESRPAENSSGERTASRREESANLAQTVHVRFTVPNEWMMGIHGAKATLVNRSSETVQKAIIEVQYFDDDNQLLQKKTISFDKVGGKDSKTVAIPDHPTATKVDYSLVSVSGKPAA